MLLNTSESLGQAAEALDALQCGAVLIESDGQIAHPNVRFCQMIQRPVAELIRQRFWDLCDPGDAQKLRATFEQDAGGSAERETRLLCSVGQSLPVIVSGGPSASAVGRSRHRVFTVIDISRQKRAEERFHEQYQEVSRLSDAVLEQALDLKHYSHALEEKIQKRTAELREANLDSIMMLAVASEARDTDTGDHVLRIKEYSHTLAREFGLPEAECEEIGFSAILHDVGKIHVPDEILKKPGRLTVEERKTMEYHAIAGEHILSNRPFFDLTRVIARSHHENWDGSGYPDQTAGEGIPLAARIVHLVDVFDALTSARVYKPAWTLSEAAAEIIRCSGTMFDPRLTEVFRALLDAGAFEKPLALRESPSAFGGVWPAQRP